jgi:hypothetical protein
MLNQHIPATSLRARWHNLVRRGLGSLGMLAVLFGAAPTAHATVSYAFTSEFGTFNFERAALLVAPTGATVVVDKFDNVRGLYSEPAGCTTANVNTICQAVRAYTPSVDPDQTGQSGNYLLFLMPTADLAGVPTHELYVAIFDPAVATQFGTFGTTSSYRLVDGANQTLLGPGTLTVTDDTLPQGVPEPPVLALLAVGLLALRTRRRPA